MKQFVRSQFLKRASQPVSKVIGAASMVPFANLQHTVVVYAGYNGDTHQKSPRSMFTGYTLSTNGGLRAAFWDSGAQVSLSILDILNKGMR